MRRKKAMEEEAALKEAEEAEEKNFSSTY